MSIALYISKRFYKIYKGAFSRPVIRISTASIALSIAVMVISVVIVKGFQTEVRKKVIGFHGHIRIKTFQTSAVDEQTPIEYDREDIFSLQNKLHDIVSIQPVAEKSGILKTDSLIDGCILKGVNDKYNTDFILSSIISGNFPEIHSNEISNEVLISEILSKRLHYKTDDTLKMYFLLEGETQPRARKFRISGIYNTGMYEFDRKYIFGDIRHIRRLNDWKENEAGSIEIIIRSYSDIQKLTLVVSDNVGYDLEVKSIQDIYPEIFNWLNLLDMNVIVIIIIMLVVSLISALTILLIRILEKTNSVGILKSLGLPNSEIRKVFLYVSTSVLLKGILIGNAIGLGFSAIQKYFHLISLNQDTYYVSTVPVYFDTGILIFVNFLMLFSGMLIMVVPSLIISKIYPAATLRFK